MRLLDLTKIILHFSSSRFNNSHTFISSTCSFNINYSISHLEHFHYNNFLKIAMMNVCWLHGIRVIAEGETETPSTPFPLVKWRSPYPTFARGAGSRNILLLGSGRFKAFGYGEWGELDFPFLQFAKNLGGFHQNFSRFNCRDSPNWRTLPTTVWCFEDCVSLQKMLIAEPFIRFVGDAALDLVSVSWIMNIALGSKPSVSMSGHWRVRKRVSVDDYGWVAVH